MTTKYQVCLTDEERARLRTLVGQGVASARMLAHARVLLKADHSEAGPGWTDVVIAGALDLGRSTVARVRPRYVGAGVEAALARAAPDRVYERTLDGAQEARLIALTCSSPPAGQARWTRKLLAAHLVALEVVDTISYETVRRTLKQTTSNRG